MNALTCALTLILMCQSKPAVALNLAHAAVAFGDTYTTQRNYDLCRVLAGCDARKLEDNPLARPFQAHGKPLAYVSTYAGVAASSFVSQKMRGSRNKWLRRLAPWVQVGLTAASGYGITVNVLDFNRALTECGQGCRDALRNPLVRPREPQR